MKVTGIIEKGSDNRYSIICNEEIGNFCLGGFGDTLDEAKADFLEVIEDAKQTYQRDHGTLPEELSDVTVEYKYDLQSFFAYFDWINISKFAQVAGVNESKLRLYKVGKAFAGERTKGKIQSAIRRMSAELASASL
jgi:predicted RNase H-like HicB family nuclease